MTLLMRRELKRPGSQVSPDPSGTDASQKTATRTALTAKGAVLHARRADKPPTANPTSRCCTICEEPRPADMFNANRNQCKMCLKLVRYVEPHNMEQVRAHMAAARSKGEDPFACLNGGQKAAASFKKQNGQKPAHASSAPPADAAGSAAAASTMADRVKARGRSPKARGNGAAAAAPDTNACSANSGGSDTVWAPEPSAPAPPGDTDKCGDGLAPMDTDSDDEVHLGPAKPPARPQAPPQTKPEAEPKAEPQAQLQAKPRAPPKAKSEAAAKAKPEAAPKAAKRALADSRKSSEVSVPSSKRRRASPPAAPRSSDEEPEDESDASASKKRSGGSRGRKAAGSRAKQSSDEDASNQWDYDAANFAGDKYWILEAPPEKESSTPLTAAVAREHLGWEKQRFDAVHALIQKNLIDASEKASSNKAFVEAAKRYTPEQLADIKEYFNLKCKVEGHTKIKGFRIAGVTKSCHQCQYQHVFRQCTCVRPDCECRATAKTAASDQPVCQHSVCWHCIEKQYESVGLKYEHESGLCPRCMGICNCRFHLRKETHGAKPPSYTDEDTADRFTVNLALIAPAATAMVSAWRAEAAYDNITNLLEVPVEALGKGERMLCGRCHTAIADLHRTCAACETDICVLCCEELRVSAAAAAAHEHAIMSTIEPDSAASPPQPSRPANTSLRCPNPKCCAASMSLRRILGNEYMSSMLEVAENREAIEGWGREALAAPFGVPALVPGSLPTAPTSLHFKSDWPEEVQPIWSRPESAAWRVPGQGCPAQEAAAPEGAAADAPPRASSRTAPESQAEKIEQLLGPSAPVPATLDELRERLQQVDDRAYWTPTEEEIAESRQPGGTMRATPPIERADVVSEEEWASRRRLAAWMVNESEQHLLCLDASDVADVGPDLVGEERELAERRQLVFKAEMWRRWQAGQPIIVAKVSGKMPWDPPCMQRATREMGNKNQKVKALEGEDALLQVQRCSDWKWIPPMNQRSFFSAYAVGGVLYDRSKPARTLLKLKDFPASANFRDRLPRHFQDFKEMVPLPELTRMDVAPHNLATLVHPDSNPCDLGPKCYIAFGRTEERGCGDSVTMVHLDMCDAVNVTLHQQGLNAHASSRHARSGDEPWQPPHYQGAGAVWDIWQRKDLGLVRQFMRETWHLQSSQPDRPEVLPPWEDPIATQQYMFTDDLRRLMWHRHRVQGWHLEQHLGEAIFIPAGCAHQVRNLDSCIKVAVDFVSPHNLALCLHMAQEIRAARNPEEAVSYGSDSFSNDDRLAAQSITVHAVKEMLPFVRSKLQPAAAPAP